MQKYLVVFIVFFVSTVTYAKSSCGVVNRSKLSIAIHQSNFANANTTRTREGGPYHPEASKKNGNVKYPVFDAIKEYKALSADALTLKNFASSCKEVTNIVNNPNSTALEYLSGNVKRDTFNFKKNMDLVSWVREFADGKSEIHNF